MTGTNGARDPESTLAAWLDEGPTDLPDATRRAILTALPTTAQARRGPIAPWRFTHMNTFARGAAVLVVAIVAIGALALLAGQRDGVGGPGPTPVPNLTPSAESSTPTGTAPPLPALDATFVSPSYGYEIRYPTGWTVTAGTGPWPVGTNHSPGDPILDSIITPSGDYQMRVSAASLALPKGMTMEAFRAFASPYSSPFDNSPCIPMFPLPGQVTIDYQKSPGSSLEKVNAVVSINGCAALAGLGGNVYDLEAIAGGRGYEFILDGRLTTADVLAWISTIKLEPASASAASPAPSR